MVFGFLFDGILSNLRPRLSLADGDHRVVTFDVDVAGFDGNPEGLNLIRLGEGGRLEDVTVFLRPLGALERDGASVRRPASGMRLLSVSNAVSS